jgi:FGGY-family pentulose kinase
MMRDAVIGVDVGTGSARAGIFTPDGRRLGLGRHPIGLWRPDALRAEHASADIWAAVCTAVRAALDAAGPVAPRGIGFDATCSLVVLDRAGHPLPLGEDPARDTICWMDHRAEAEAEEASATGAEALRHVGGRFSPEMQVPKLMWLHRHAPQVWARIGHLFDLPDFLTWRATGAASRSVCSLTCKWGWLAHEARWDTGLLHAVGLGALEAEGFARIGTQVLPLGVPVGAGLSDAAAAELGLPAGLPVSSSIIDAHAGGLGCLGMALDGRGLEEATARQRVALIGGTSSCHMAVSPGPRFVPGVWGPYFSAMVPGWWLNEGGQSATGALLDHLVGTHPARAGAGEEPVFDWLNRRLAALVPAGAPAAAASRGLHLYPDFHGNRSPVADPTLRGLVSGLPLSATADDLARLYLAAVQGIAYGTREILEALSAQGYTPDTLIATGGDARNAVFLREHADATGCRVVLPEEPEAVLLGAAMLGATAAGLHADVAAAMAAMSRPGRVVAPDPAPRALHDARYRIHRRMRDDQLAYRAIEAGAG